MDDGVVRPRNAAGAPATVHAQLRDAILGARLAPGTRLIETELARRYAVSRTPLREALRALEHEGLVERVGSGGVRVPPVRLDEVREVAAVRSALEVLAVEAACATVARAPDRAAAATRFRDLVDVLDLRWARAADRDDVGELAAVGAEFHRAIVDLAKNAYLAQSLEQANLRLARYRAVAPPGRDDVVRAEHLAIARAIEAADIDLATDLMRRHLAAALSALEDALASASGGAARGAG